MPQPISRKVKTIVPDERTILLDRQRRVFRIACDPRRYGLTLGIIAADSGLGYDSVRHYAAGETAMPMCAFLALIGVLPDELLSLLLPEGRLLVQVPVNVDHDAACEAMRAYVDAKERAHHPESPAGREISDCEDETLRAKLTVVKAA